MDKCKNNSTYQGKIHLSLKFITKYYNVQSIKHNNNYTLSIY